MKNFRVYEHAALRFGEQTNILFGENGAGKTTVLEAIHCLAYTRSFKTHLDSELIRYETTEARIGGNFRGDKKNDQRVEMSLSEKQPKQIKVNGALLTSQAGLIGRIPLVCLAPEDSVVTVGAPADRRRFFDKLFSQVDTVYLTALQQYNRVLKQRNAHLNDFAVNGTPVNSELLLALDTQVVKQGAIIQQKRAEYVQKFKSFVYQIYLELEKDKTFKAAYIPAVKVKPGESVEQAFQRELEASRPADMRRGTTTTGIQRDLFLFYLNHQDIRRYGSMGEHKLALVALKFAEGRFLEDYLTEKPIYLLDDLFAELDIKRSVQIIQSLPEGYQVFITSTDLADLRRHGLEIESENLTVFDTGKLRDVAA
ncbi:MAG: DNA replication and repair protein RecF [Candidatus Marinimicrobia bacterium]|nr:DNA replication and repair protein RecF [Candidatus Neomarinimicrobiota bacterium]MCF7902166.1 DNA replication and repair protein RecF [Candidatus Neomarinimicrobiota bacterium]